MSGDRVALTIDQETAEFAADVMAAVQAAWVRESEPYDSDGSLVPLYLDAARTFRERGRTLSLPIVSRMSPERPRTFTGA